MLIMYSSRSVASFLISGFSVLVFISSAAGDSVWMHPMHTVYKAYPEDNRRTTPAGDPSGQFLSLSGGELLVLRRILARLPYNDNQFLEAIDEAANTVEEGLDVDVSWQDVVPDVERKMVDMWRFDEDFRQTALHYLAVPPSGGTRFVPENRETPAPEDRNQTQGSEGCFADIDAYIGPLVSRWLWDTLTLNNVSVGLPRPPEPDEQYKYLVDSLGRRPTGLYEGYFHWMASYEECTSQVINHVVRLGSGLPILTENRTFQGKYARLDMPIALDMMQSNISLPFTLGICVPDTCTKEDVWAYIMYNNTILSNLIWGIEDVYLGQETDWDTDKPAKAAFGILLGGGIIIFLASCYDGWGRHRIIRNNIKKRGSRKNDSEVLTKDDLKNAKDYLYEKPGILDKLEVAFSSYSLYTNLRNIFTTRPRYKKYHIPALDGLRAITFLWIIYGMTYVYGIVYFECWTTANLIPAFRSYMEDWRFMSVVQVYQANVTLFFISGFVCVNMWYRHWNRNQRRLSFGMVIKWIWARYMSFMPGMMGMLMIYTCLLRYTDGPLQPRDVTDSVNCLENWWITMLLFHNLFRVHEQCFAWTWMFAAVWQLNLASLFIIIPLVLAPIAGYVMIVLMYIAYVVILVIWNQKNYDRENSWYFDILQTPWCNAGPYCIGMILAIIMHKSRGKRQHMAWPLVLFFWICATVLIGTVVYAPWDYLKPDGNDWSKTGHVAFDTMAPQMMALGVAWLTWASHNGYGGVIGNLLNWRFFTVLSKIALPSAIFMAPAMVGHLYARVQIFYIYDSHMSYLYRGQLIEVFVYAMFAALSFQHPIGRSMMIQTLAITRLELLLHSRHPEILDELTGDPMEDEWFWDELEERDRANQERAVSVVNVPIKSTKAIGGFIPCQEFSFDGVATSNKKTEISYGEYEKLSIESSPPLAQNTFL